VTRPFVIGDIFLFFMPLTDRNFKSFSGLSVIYLFVCLYSFLFVVQTMRKRLSPRSLWRSVIGFSFRLFKWWCSLDGVGFRVLIFFFCWGKRGGICSSSHDEWTIIQLLPCFSLKDVFRWSEIAFGDLVMASYDYFICTIFFFHPNCFLSRYCLGEALLEHV